jgi:hypothetical protein
MEVPPGHAVPPAGLGNRVATHEHGERRVGVIPQKEPHFPPPVRRTRDQEVEVGINSTARSNKYVSTAQSCHFYSRALLLLGTEEVVPQIEVGLNPHIGLTQGHKGHLV